MCNMCHPAKLSLSAENICTDCSKYKDSKACTINFDQFYVCRYRKLTIRNGPVYQEAHIAYHCVAHPAIKAMCSCWEF